MSIFFAIAAAITFAWSAAAMHHSTSSAPAGTRGPLALLIHVLQEWRWLSGMAASLLGLALHAAALSGGSLAVVQPLLAGGLVLALFMRARLDRRWPSRAEASWSVAVGVSLSLFLLLAGSTKGSAGVSGGSGGWLLGVGAAAAAWCFWRAHLGAATTPLPHAAAIFLGAGTGIIFGLIGGTLKAVTGEPGIVAALTSWPLWCLIGLGIAGFFANQTTYRRAPLVQALPVINVMNPLISLLFGLVGFHEMPSGGWGRHLLELVALVAALWCIAHLTRLETAPLETPSRAGQPGDIQAALSI